MWNEAPRNPLSKALHMGWKLRLYFYIKGRTENPPGYIPNLMISKSKSYDSLDIKKQDFSVRE